jgi:hypothetical protein
MTHFPIGFGSTVRNRAVDGLFESLSFLEEALREGGTSKWTS